MASKLAEYLKRWREHPEAFVRECIGAVPDPWQAVALQVLKDHGRVSIAACHGVGKDTLAAWAILWTMFCFPHPKCPATSPTQHQLYDLLWSEISKWFIKIPEAFRVLYVLKADRFERKAHKETWFSAARVARKENSEGLQGFHADTVLVVVDEASGVPPIIFEVLEGAMTGPRPMMLLIGNPTQSSGYFHSSHHEDRSRWFTMRICAKAAVPDGVDGGKVWYSDRPSAEYVAAMERKYGRESNVFRVRVLGLFPKSDDDQTIPLEWVEAALMRDLYPKEEGALCLGIDVARFGSDHTAWVVREGRNVLEAGSWHGNDIASSTGKFIAMGKLLEQRLSKTDYLYLFIDTTGLGAGVADNIRAWLYGNEWVDPNTRTEKRRWVVIDVDAGSKSPEETCMRMRDALWWRAREYFRVKEPALASDIDPEVVQQLTGELASPRYDFSPNGLIKVESKEALKDRGVPSPNLADALIHTFDFEATKTPKPKDRGWRDDQGTSDHDWMVS